MKTTTFIDALKCVKDKDVATRNTINHVFAQTQSMFTWGNLPVSVPQIELERTLQTHGNVFWVSVDGELYALKGATGGVTDAYERPTEYTIANAALNLSRTYKIDVDGVLMQNDTNGNSLYPIIARYAALLTESIISLNTASVLSRITMLISASDNKTFESANQYLEHIKNGDISIIGDSAFLGGVRLQTAPVSNSQYVTQLIELVQYLKASLCNEIGLNANYNMKRERLNTAELSTNIDVLLPYVDNMLMCRKRAVERVNAMFGTSITVDLNSTWKLNRENYERLLETITNDTTDVATDADDADTRADNNADVDAPDAPDAADDVNDADDADDADDANDADDNNDDNKNE